MPAPELHEPVPPRTGHYTTAARQWQAQVGRVIIAQPGNPCRLYDCVNSPDRLLRVCTGQTEVGDVVQAVQWLFVGVGGAWQEGTIFLQDAEGVAAYLQRKGCREVVQ